LVTTYSERTIMTASIIERYVTDHPRAADTSAGIRDWWLAAEREKLSLADVQTALDYLVEATRLSRIVLVDGTVIYSRGDKGGETK
jgi:hypothetical protein